MAVVGRAIEDDRLTYRLIAILRSVAVVGVVFLAAAFAVAQILGSDLGRWLQAGGLSGVVALVMTLTSRRRPPATTDASPSAPSTPEADTAE